MEDIYKEHYRKSIEWLPYKPYGGQHVGVQTEATLFHADLGIQIRCGYFRSQTENRRVCLELFEEFLNKVR